MSVYAKQKSLSVEKRDKYFGFEYFKTCIHIDGFYGFV